MTSSKSRRASTSGGRTCSGSVRLCATKTERERRLSSADTIKGTIEEELYDVLYYTVSPANVYDIDLTQCFYLKEELNRTKWGR